MGYGELNDNDLKLILQVGDLEEDGVISLKSWRNLVPQEKKNQKSNENSP